MLKKKDKVNKKVNKKIMKDKNKIIIIMKKKKNKLKFNKKIKN